MKISRTSMAALVAATMFVGAAGTAKADSLFSVGSEAIHYINYENIFTPTGTERPSNVLVSNPAGPGNTTLTGSAASVVGVGDIVIGVLQVTAANVIGGANITLPTPITGVFALQVSGFSVGPTGDTIINYAPLTTNPGTLTGTDGSTFTLPAAWNYGAKQEFAFYKNTLSNAGTSNGLTLANSYATFVPAGPAYFTLGAQVTGNGDQAGYIYADVTNPGPTSPTLSSYAGLNFIINPGAVFSPVSNSGAPIDATVQTDMTVNNSVSINNVPLTDASVNGSDGLITPWDFQSVDPAKVQVISLVPVPAAAWTGLSMLAAMGGIAALRRRKQVNA